MKKMKAKGTFTTKNFKTCGISCVPDIQTGLPTGVSTMEKIYIGQIEGHSATIFTAAFDPSTGMGAYAAMESFEGTMLGMKGTFNFIHTAATSGKNRSNEFFSIVAGSGTGAFKGIRGTGGITIDNDGTHRIWFDFEITS